MVKRLFTAFALIASAFAQLTPSTPSSGGSGGAAQLQVRDAADANWVNVGFNVANLTLPVSLQTSSAVIGHIICDSGCGSAAIFADNSAFTAGTSAITNFGAVFNDGLSAVTSGNAAAPRITSDRMLYINIGKIGGAAPTTAGKLDIKGADGDVFVRQTTGANLHVNVDSAPTTAVTESGTWTVQPGNTANTTAWKVDGSAVNQPILGTKTNNAAAPGATNIGVLPAIANTVAPTYTDGDLVLLSTDLKGNLRTGGPVYGPDNAGVAPTQGPVEMGGNDGTNVRPLKTDTSGVLQIAIPGTVTTVLPTQPFLNVSDFNDVTAGTPSPTGAVVGVVGGKWAETQVINSKTLNNVEKCDQYSVGSAFDVQVTACIAAVIAKGGGVADARGLFGAQTGTTEIDVGNGSSIPVTLLLSPFITYDFTSTTAGACGFKVFDGSRLLGTLVGTTHQAIIKNTHSSTATGSMVCTNYGAGTGQYVTIQGLQLYNPGAPSNSNFTNGLLFAKNLFDTSSVRDMVIANEGGDGLVVEAACCASLFFDIISDGNHAAGARPVVIKSLTGDLQPINAINFHNLSADHPGAGLNAITIQNTYTSALQPCSISFTGYLYMEGNSTDTTTALLNNDSCNSILIQSLTAQFRSVTSTAVPINITHTSVAGISPTLQLGLGQIENSPQTFPTTFINDVANSLAVATDGQGEASYSEFPFTFTASAPAGIGDARFTPNAAVGLHIRVNVNNKNPLRLEDSTLSARAIDLGPNVTSTGTYGVRDQTGAKNLYSVSWVTPFPFQLPNGVLDTTEVAAPSGVAGIDRCYGDSTAHAMKCSYNNSAFSTVALNPPLVAGTTDLGTTALPFGNLWLGTAATNNFKFQPAATAASRVITMADPLAPVNMPYVIASGTSAMTTAAVGAGACGTTVTTAATNAATTDTVVWERNAAVTNANGGILILNGWLTSGNVNWNYCNPGAASNTPTAMTVNWKVIR